MFTKKPLRIALARTFTLLLVVYSRLASAQTQDFTLTMFVLSKTTTEQSCRKPGLWKEGVAIFHVNQVPIPSYTQVDQAFLPNGDSYGIIQAPFSHTILRIGDNDIGVGIQTVGGFDYCTSTANRVDLHSGTVSRELFSFERKGTHFDGHTSIRLSLQEISPALAQGVMQLLAEIQQGKVELQRQIGNLEDFEQEAQQLDALERDVQELLEGGFDQLTNEKLDQLLKKYNGIPLNVQKALGELVQGLRLQIEDLRKELARIVATLTSELAELESSLGQQIEASGFELDNQGNYTTELDDSQVPDVSVPDLSQTDPFDPSNDTYDQYADEVLARLASYVNGATVTHRHEFAAEVSAWLTVQRGLEASIQQRATVSQSEVSAFLNAQQRVLGYVQTYMDGDFWFRDAPIPTSTRNFIAKLKGRPEAAHKAEQLKDALNSWPAGGSPEGTLVLHTIDGISGGYDSLDEGAAAESPIVLRVLSNALDGAIAHSNAIAHLAVGFSPAGDYLDLCEVITGREWCMPGGQELTRAERIQAGAGLIFGSRTFWAGVSKATSVVAPGIATAVGAFIGKWSDLTEAQYKSIKELLGDEAVDMLGDIPGLDAQELLKQLGKDRLLVLTSHLRGAAILELTQLKMFRFSGKKETLELLEKSKGAQAFKLPSYRGKSMAALETDLQARNFKLHPSEGGTPGQKIFLHADGTMVRIAPNGTSYVKEPHYKVEILDPAMQPPNLNDVEIRVTDRGIPVPQLAGARDELKQWALKNVVSNPPPKHTKDVGPQLTEALVSVWGDATHVSLALP